MRDERGRSMPATTIAPRVRKEGCSPVPQETYLKVGSTVLKDMQNWT